MMKNPGITLLGLGPGEPEMLTRQAWQLLNGIPEIYLRTRQHPVVDDFPSQLQVHSFDHLYEREESFDMVYAQIVAQVIELGQRSSGVVYAVPGHPYVAEATSPEIALRARELGIPVRVVAGLSFLEPMMAAINQDPLPSTYLVDALELAVSHVPPFPPHAPAVVAQLYSRAIAAEVKLTLMALYPDEHPVQLVHAAGTPFQQVESLALYEIDRSSNIGLLTSLYVPSLGSNTSFETFQEVIAHLRAPDGCPWDREQTHQTLRSHLLEEAYEVIAALDAEDSEAMREELGDLLLQIVLHAQIASETGDFTMSDVLKTVNSKIVHRHPHVFGDLDLQDVDGVLHNWEQLKEAERKANGNVESSLLDGVAQALPALIQASEYQKRAARVGFDWPEMKDVVEKVNEELREVFEAPNQGEQAAEIGDLIFAVVNLARWYGIDAESALRGANNRFRSRFSKMEKQIRSQGRSVTNLTPEEFLGLWRLAKPSV